MAISCSFLKKLNKLNKMNTQAQPTTTGDWDDYFRYRGVTPDFYKSYTLPGYMVKALPSDKTARVCDIGCGFGQTLAAVRDLGYANVFGIEPSPDGYRHASSRGLEVYHGKVAEVAQSLPKRAEFAYMSHVLEHIPKSEIIPTLTMIKQSILSPGGKLLIAVPNAQSYTGAYWRYEDWTHEVLFTSGSLLHVMRAAGFENAAIYDGDCMMNTGSLAKKVFRTPFLALYKWNYQFWMRITASSIHSPSPLVFSFEVKAIG
jgi:SAM-dependent methyltransferase